MQRRQRWAGLSGRVGERERNLTVHTRDTPAQLDNVTVDNDNSLVTVQFTPTIPHCNMATLIGLCIRVKLLRSLPRRLKVRVRGGGCARARCRRPASCERASERWVGGDSCLWAPRGW